MWFKVDDQFPKNRKARAIRRSHPSKSRDLAPLGIWTIAGAISDDGWIALDVLEDWDDDAEIHAARLVKAGLWHHEERDHEPGYTFNDWHEHNPSTGASDSGAFGNHKRWHLDRGIVQPGCSLCPQEPELPPEPAESIGGRSGGDIGAIDFPSHTRPDPTRPDPTKSNNSCSSADAESVSDVDAEFAEWWIGYPRKKGKGQAIRAYRTARKKVDAETLTSTLAAQRQSLMSKGETYCPHAATWLNGERWADEASANPEPLSRVQQHLALARQLAAEESGPTLGELA